MCAICEVFYVYVYMFFFPPLRFLSHISLALLCSCTPLMPEDARRSVRQAMLWGANMKRVGGEQAVSSVCAPVPSRSVLSCETPFFFRAPESSWQHKLTLLQLRVSRRLSTPLTDCCKSRKTAARGPRSASMPETITKEKETTEEDVECV